ncbi:DUF4307 domain-containing protein [Cellulomonas fimi]|uniref:DUF4307 domain-containing protein n=1 Tax=Cellulomonas fimi TaxID=1708 RepID=A0A7Y0LXQ0_CELFI|nr:DUF4307 domain-containing protein [Cellulomonas fimi]NMR19839.1 DUF4307 domain-containing protein [Cellulomonas fimi]
MTGTTSPRLPEGRYGPVPTARRGRLVRGAAVAAAAAVATLGVWIGTSVLQDPVQWESVGYKVEGPALVQVTFDVIKDPDATARCTVRALNQSFAEVGVREVTAGPSGSRVQRLTVPVATQELAVTGVAEGCRLVP